MLFHVMQRHAILLSYFFDSVFFNQNINITVLKGLNKYTFIHLPIVSEALVLTSMRQLNDKSRAESNGIPSFPVKDCAEDFTVPMNIILNRALRSQKFP